VQFNCNCFAVAYTYIGINERQMMMMVGKQWVKSSALTF